MAAGLGLTQEQRTRLLEMFCHNAQWHVAHVGENQTQHTSKNTS